MSSPLATMPLFSLGHCTITPAASAVLAKFGLDPSFLFARHGSGDWGEPNDWLHAANDEAVRRGPSIHAIQSRYTMGEETEILVMTSTDRTRTHLLLASEFEDREVGSREGYALWAATYDAVPNPLIAVEEPVVDSLLTGLPPVRTAADIGTGTGRLALKLARRGVRVTAVDQSPEMLAPARRAAAEAGLTGIAFVEAALGEGPLPVPARSCDLVTCALMLCHLPDLAGAVAECGRLVRPGGHLLLTDFHPAAVAWGWRTAFIEPEAAYILPNPGHSREDYLQAVADAGCTVQDVQDIALGGEPYGDCSRAALEQRGVPPLALTILARKPG